eukprot:m.111242 g.111242  ORF g.111242 m.111242 type:complete len:599 (-) comp21360_c0_seq14:103-1899(-)
MMLLLVLLALAQRVRAQTLSQCTNACSGCCQPTAGGNCGDGATRGCNWFGCANQCDCTCISNCYISFACAGNPCGSHSSSCAGGTGRKDGGNSRLGSYPCVLPTTPPSNVDNWTDAVTGLTWRAQVVNCTCTDGYTGGYCETQPTTSPAPTAAPTVTPTKAPTTPTAAPTAAPTATPTKVPTAVPTTVPTATPTTAPTTAPTTTPTAGPTTTPTATPTTAPTDDPCWAYTCVLDCNTTSPGGPCGWNNFDRCASGEFTNALERATLVGCTPDPTTTLTAVPTTSPNALPPTSTTTAPAISQTSDGNDGGTDGSITTWIAVGVVLVLVLVAAGILFVRRPRARSVMREQDKDRQSGGTIHNAVFDLSTGRLSSATGSRRTSQSSADGGYFDVDGRGESFEGFEGAGGVSRRTSTPGADSALLPMAWQSLPAGFFPQEEDFPKVLLSYQSHSTGKNVGKAWMWAVANGLRAAGITSFNGYQVTGGENWQQEWFGVLPECEVLVVMLSKSYFPSEACVHELKEACSQRKRIIPIYLEEVDISLAFLGQSTQRIKAANFIRPFVSGNCVPPPDQGVFQGHGADDFQRNMATLVKTIKTKFLK